MATLPITKRMSDLLATQQGKSYAVVAVTLFLLLIMIVFAVFPVVSSLFFQLEMNGAKQQILDKMEQKRITIRNLITQEQEKRAVTLALNAAMPTSLNQAFFLTKLEQLSQETGTTLNIVNFGEISEKRDLKTLFNLTNNLTGSTVSISAAGSRFDLEQLLIKLEEMRRVVNIQSINISRVDEADNQGNVFKIDIQAEIYYIGE